MRSDSSLILYWSSLKADGETTKCHLPRTSHELTYAAKLQSDQHIEHEPRHWVGTLPLSLCALRSLVIIADVSTMVSVGTGVVAP